MIKNKMRMMLFVVAGLFILQACNKEFEDIPSLPVTPAPTGSSLADIINNDTSYSFFKAAVTKAGMMSMLSNTSLRFTAFVPDNNAFRLSGIPSIAVLNAAFDVPTITGIVSYHIVPQLLPADQIPTSFPNLQYPTLLNPAPSVSALLRLTIFPSKRATGAWVNNVPLIATNIMASNGIIHKTLTLVSPPSKSLYQIITSDTTLSFLVAALARADSGRVSITDGSLTEALKSIGANLTLFAPVNQAFRDLLIAMGLPPSPAVFSALPVNTVRGMVAYHIMGVRAFSVNMPTTPTFLPTLLNTSIPSHPGVNVVVSFTGPFVSSFLVTGVGNGGNAAMVIAQDINATNGVAHKIDRVLLPQ